MTLSHWHRVDAILLRPDLAPSEKLLLIALAHRWNPSHKRPLRVGVARLCSDTGQSRSTVKRALAALKKAGIVEVKSTGRSSIFKIRWVIVTHQKVHHDPSEGSPRPIREVVVNDQKVHDDPSTERKIDGSLTEGGTEALQRLPPPLSYKDWIN